MCHRPLGGARPGEPDPRPQRGAQAGQAPPGRLLSAARRGWDRQSAVAWLDGHINLEAVPHGSAAGPGLAGPVSASPVLAGPVSASPVLAGPVSASPVLARMGLARMVELMALLGNPESAYPVIHVTGTNGKGSTAAMLGALLGARGLRVGLYTSPDLESLNERMAIGREPVEDVVLAEVLGKVADATDSMLAGPPSRFEILTAAALDWFCDEAVDAAVVEVGMGGLHDATNVVEAQVAVVTNVSLDHADVMGPTTADIAREKSGIVKPGSTLILGETDPTLSEVFGSAGAARCWVLGADFACESSRIAHGGRVLDLRTPAGRYPDVFLPLHGAHQAANAACALAAAEAFFDAPLHPDVVAEGFGAVVVPGRIEVLARRPLCILDGAHNPAGAAAVGAALASEFAPVRRWVLVMGLLEGREPAEMLAALAGVNVGAVITCAPASPRAVDPARVAAVATAAGIESEVAATVGQALDRAKQLAGRDEGILVTGSLYLVGEARTILLGPAVPARPGR